MTQGDKIKDFVRHNIESDHRIISMDGDASLRSYARVYDAKQSYILMDSSLDPQSMRSFLKVGEALSNSYSAPKVLAVDHDNHLILLEDLGEESYTNILRFDQGRELELYSHAVELLVDLHQVSVGGCSFDSYSRDLLLDEAILLVDWYYPLIIGKELPKKMRREYIDIWLSIFSSINFQSKCLVLRDYHADNLIWLKDRESIQKVGLLDFQDAVIGSFAYDLVSLLEDARRDVSEDTAKSMIDLYIKKSKFDRDQYLIEYNILGAQRNSKILGIFARKFLQDKNVRYLSFLPRVLAYLSKDLKHPILLPMKEWFIKAELLNEKHLTETLDKL